MSTDASPFPPSGFEVYPPISPVMEALGTLYARHEADGGITLGLRVAGQHLNHQQVMHGGTVATLADNAMGYHAAKASGGAVVTVHLGIDYLAAIPPGAWLEVRSELDRRGKRMIFMACKATIDGNVAFRANAVFSAVTKRSPGTA